MKKIIILLIILMLFCSCSAPDKNSEVEIVLTTPFEHYNEYQWKIAQYLSIETEKDTYSVNDNIISFKRTVSPNAPDNGITLGIQVIDELQKFENNKWYKVAFREDYVIKYVSLHLPKDYCDTVDINLEEHFDCLPLPAGQYRIVYEGAISNTFVLE